MVNNWLRKKFEEKPYMLRMGSKLIASRCKVPVKDVIDTRKAIRKKEEPELNSKAPKILIFDIETSPMKAYIWKRWKENISLDQTISEWFCICWTAKWLYSTEVMTGVLTPEEARNEDDSRIVKELWKLFNEADIIITHNGDKFDIPKMSTRFIVNDLPPTQPYRTIDTLKVAKKQFGFSSNKLDSLAMHFGIDTKLDTNFDLWKRCLEGDPEALEYMSTYNIKDVEILEEVYLRLRPWIKFHPNIRVYGDYNNIVCAACSSEDLEEVEGQYYYTSVGKYKLYRCKECGAYTRGRDNLNKKKKLEELE